MLLVTGQSHERRGYRADIPWRLLALVSDQSPAAVCWDGLEDTVGTEALRLIDPSQTAWSIPSPLDASVWAAGFAFRGGWSVPSSKPTAVRGDLSLEAPHLAVVCRSAVRRGEEQRFANGVTFRWQEREGGEAPADEVRPDAPRRRFPLDHAVAAALVTDDGRAYAVARTIHLALGLSLPFADASERPALRLALDADVLKGATFTAYDGGGRKKAQGTVEALPFLVDPSDGTFRVEFVRAPSGKP